jgi:hypothetical protein
MTLLMTLAWPALGWTTNGPIIVNQSSRDITLLTAKVLSRTVGSSVLLGRCDRVFSSHHQITYDCKNALEQRFKVPLLQSKAYVKASEHQSTPGEGADTPLVLIRVVARDTAFREAGSMGFYVTNPKGILYFDKNQVRAERRVRLKDGTMGVPFSFLSLLPRSSPDDDRQTRSFGFKPFIDFHRPSEGRIYRNWDLEPTEGYDNYLLLQGYPPPLQDILLIDRRDDVLLREKR